MITDKIRLEVNCVIDPITMNMNCRFITTNLMRQGMGEEMIINVSASEKYWRSGDPGAASLIHGRATSDLIRKYLGESLKELWRRLSIDDPLYKYLERWQYASEGINLSPTAPPEGFPRYIHDLNSDLAWTDAKLRYFDADNSVECVKKIKQFIEDNSNKRSS